MCVGSLLYLPGLLLLGCLLMETRVGGRVFSYDM